MPLVVPYAKSLGGCGVSVTPDQLGQAIIASGLLTAEEMKAFWKSLPPAQRSKDGEPLAKALVEAKRFFAWHSYAPPIHRFSFLTF